ncbi:hypothetical protein TIFTF001_036252 [Ficus carica]|uniref:Terpene synthase N-terminal domain-containing protein n=1 Tax=Ficus carica TaxID=3494 RepID=A0AA88JAX4_FICCA|nr:hypothetical protein TIFTF001_036252 [Ficus carica]
MESKITPSSDGNISRRSANYKPSFWHFDFIQSLGSEYALEEYTRQVDDLKEETKAILEKVTGTLAQLELIDTLQRLGISYHFDDEIKSIMKAYTTIISLIVRGRRTIYMLLVLNLDSYKNMGIAYQLKVFNSFKDEMENSEAHIIDDDQYYTMGILNLYEATFHMVKGETILEEARDLTTKYLKEYVKTKDENDVLSKLVNRALEFPLHWTAPIVEARCQRSGKNRKTCPGAEGGGDDP